MEPSIISRYRKPSLRNKVFLLIGLVLFFPVLIITVINTSIGRTFLHKSIYHQQREIVARIADRVMSYIESNNQLLRSILELNLNVKTKSNTSSVFKNVMRVNPNIIELILLNSRGEEVVKIVRQGDSIISSRNLIVRRDKDEFRLAPKGSMYISPMHLSYNRIPYLMISTKRYGIVLIAKINLENMWMMMSQIKLGEKGYAFVVNDRGELVAHREQARVLAHTDFSNLPVVKHYLSNRGLEDRKKGNPWHFYRDESGTKVASFYKDIPRLKWVAVTQIPYREVISPINRMVSYTVLSAAVFGIVFLILGYKFVNSMLNPLNKLREYAGSISKGKFDTRINIKTNDEIEELANTFNSMAESLKQLEEIRQDLISMIVHDMKSPLSGIMGGLDYLEKLKPGSEEFAGIITVAKNSAQNLLTLITNLLDISKMEDGKLTLHTEKTAMDKLLDQTIKQFDIMCRSEDKKLSTEIEEGLPEVPVDQGIILRVANNLLTNALHHTITDGNILLKVSRSHANSIEVRIADDGVGIPDEYKDKIFEKFVQVERKRARLRTGAGLGLTFCKMAVELHGGRIWVESKPEKGSAFVFSLPFQEKSN